MLIYDVKQVQYLQENCEESEIIYQSSFFYLILRLIAVLIATLIIKISAVLEIDARLILIFFGFILFHLLLYSSHHLIYFIERFFKKPVMRFYRAFLIIIMIFCVIIMVFNEFLQIDGEYTMLVLIISGLFLGRTFTVFICKECGSMRLITIQIDEEQSTVKCCYCDSIEVVSWRISNKFLK